MTVSFFSSLIVSTVISATLFSHNSANAYPKPPRSKTRTAATIRVETARLRQGPGESHKSKALLDKGRDARIVGRRDGWVKLRLQSGTEGWVRSDLVKVSKKAVPDSDASESRSARRSRSKSSATKVASAKKKSSKSTPRTASASRSSRSKTAAKPAPKAPVKVAAATTTAARVRFLRATNLRTSRKVAAEIAAAKKKPILASEKPEKVLTLPAPTPAETVAAVPVTPVETPVVSIEAAAVTPEPGSTPSPAMVAVNTRADRILRSAYSYRGTPYRMGATGRGAFDCSGFIRHIMQTNGVAMPRTAAQQYHKGTPVEKSQMQKGDLVFFKNTYRRGISHVGMYIGDGKFIHASSRGGVRVDSLSGKYYINHWAGARRPNW
jgi:cell wall-associated NlpC family hydrolase